MIKLIVWGMSPGYSVMHRFKSFGKLCWITVTRHDTVDTVEKHMQTKGTNLHNNRLRGSMVSLERTMSCIASNSMVN
ncbi:hypothetical protein BRADI_2g26083v3 [Brachypodium distachyon]|uniref:Uncharacterized protein n=1 Tax=Brachypodium distachyon TaxID=15368 RepID=A0A2K2DAJ9_BRADI|nr:hypothetical protein BRADI_2g26083v3 [Brachypodium distachyon]